MLDIYEIRTRYESGAYTYKPSIPKKLPADYVFDEDFSVKRNRELVKQHNDNIEIMKKNAREVQISLNEQLSYDVISYIMDSYGLNAGQARKVENFVYQQYHSCMCDYFSNIDTFAEFVSDIISKEG